MHRNEASLPVAQLVINDVDDELVEELDRKASSHGVSRDDEAKFILTRGLGRLPKFTAEDNRAFAEHLLSFPEIDDDMAWVFDRHDPRNARPEKPPFTFEE